MNQTKVDLSKFGPFKGGWVSKASYNSLIRNKKAEFQMVGNNGCMNSVAQIPQIVSENGRAGLESQNESPEMIFLQKC